MAKTQVFAVVTVPSTVPSALVSTVSAIAAPPADVPAICNVRAPAARAATAVVGVAWGKTFGRAVLTLSHCVHS